MAEKISRSDAEWKQQLTPEQYHIMRKKGTERPFTGEYNDCHDDGVYRCAGCGNELFDAGNKFDSGSGWPSFDQPVGEDKIATAADNGLFQRRTEVLCSACDAHLGHVFPDGPRETTGQRFCINSAALKLDKDANS